MWAIPQDADKPPVLSLIVSSKQGQEQDDCPAGAPNAAALGNIVLPPHFRKGKKIQPVSSECVYLIIFLNCFLGNIIKVIKGSKELPGSSSQRVC